MKKLPITTFFVFISLLGFSQIAESFDEAKNQGISPKVDSIYISAINVDSTKAAFAGQYKQFGNAYKEMLQKMSDYLYENGFKWGAGGKQYFNRIYFRMDGKVDYYLYKFKPGCIDEAKEKEFKRLVNEFIKDYRFPMVAKENFAQCSPVILYDPADKK